MILSCSSTFHSDTEFTSLIDNNSSSAPRFKCDQKTFVSNRCHLIFPELKVNLLISVFLRMKLAALLVFSGSFCVAQSDIILPVKLQNSLKFNMHFYFSHTTSSSSSDVQLMLLWSAVHIVTTRCSNLRQVFKLEICSHVTVAPEYPRRIHF